VYAAQRLAAAQLCTELELAHGAAPDAAHLEDAINVMQLKFPTRRIPPEIAQLLREIRGGEDPDQE
jgi:hypothetical protein